MHQYILNRKVLVLNSSWSPINITIVKEAISMIYGNSAYVITHKDLYSKFDKNIVSFKYDNLDYRNWIKISENIKEDQEDFIRSGRYKHFCPHVIKLNSYNKVPSYYIKLSRRSLYDRDHGICQYCGKNIEYRDFTVDHIIPKSKGGKTIWNNIVCSCKKCNFYKDDRTLHETGYNLIKKPEKPDIGNFAIIYRREKEYWKDFLKEKTDN